MEKYNVFRKSLVIGIIILFVGASVGANVTTNVGSEKIELELRNLSTSTRQNIVYVNNDYNETTPTWNVTHFDNIQAGVNAVNEHGTVYVCNGTYYENVVIDKPLNLTGIDEDYLWGNDRNGSIIDGEMKNDTLSIISSNSSISSFTLINGIYGIHFINASYVNLSDCNVLDNFKNGITLQYSSYNFINQCQISNHVLSGVLFDNSSYNLLFRCYIFNNWRGVQIKSSSNYNNISQCNISDNYWGIKLAQSTNTINRCHITNNVCGIMRGIGNYIYYNIFIDNEIYHAFGEIENVNTFDYNYWGGYDCVDNNGDGIGDFPYHVYGLNYDWHPLCQPNVLPIIDIIYPEKNDLVTGTIMIHGTAYDPDGTVELVQIKIDEEGEWENATGTTLWSIEWNTDDVSEGKHIIYARCKDNSNYYSPEDSIPVYVDRSPPMVTITKPEEGYFYFRNIRIFRNPFGFTLIIGPKEGIDVEVKIWNKHYSNIEYVYGYINNEHKLTLEYDWIDNQWEAEWEETRYKIFNLEFICSLKIEVKDKAGNIGNHTIDNVWYFNK